MDLSLYKFGLRGNDAVSFGTAVSIILLIIRQIQTDSDS